MFLIKPFPAVAMPQKAIEPPWFLAHGSYLSTCEKKYLVLSCFYSLLYEMFNIFLIFFYVRNTWNHILKILWSILVCLFYAVLTCILFCDYEGLKKILSWLTRDETLHTHWLSSILLPNVSHFDFGGDFEALLTILAVFPEPNCPV